MGCKTLDVLKPKSQSVDTTIAFDQERKKCYLCTPELDNNYSPPTSTVINSCHYTKKLTIPLTCGTIYDLIKIGDQVNLQRGNEVDWDSIIMQEDDIDSAYVYYNEVALREIVVTFYLDFGSPPSTVKTCVLNSAITISSTIAKKIKSL